MSTLGQHSSFSSPHIGTEQLFTQQSFQEVEEAHPEQVVGTTTTVMESSWDVADHDYSRGCQTPLDMDLTPAEDELITQLTKAMGRETTEVTPSTIMKEEPIIVQGQEPATPDILKDFLDFQNINTTPATNKVNVGQNPLSVRAPSPISKAQILDFLQDIAAIPSPGSSGSSESGYDSASSPKSEVSFDSSGDYLDELVDSPVPVARTSVNSPVPMVRSPASSEDCESSLDIESFSELFPSLF